MRIQFTLRTLLFLPLALGLLLGAWLGWIKPRLDFNRQRQASIDLLTWGGKTEEFEFRTGQATVVLERATYKSLRSPVLTYAMFLLEKKPIIIADWISVESNLDGIGVVLPEDDVIPLQFAPGARLHSEGTFLYTNFIYPEEQYPSEWKRIVAAGKCRAFLMKKGLRVSNQVQVRTLGRQEGRGGSAPLSAGSA